jgi:xanthosine utilization system XapX-like protein
LVDQTVVLTVEKKAEMWAGT